MRQSESETPGVPKQATQGVNPPERSWSWVEVSVWNERMLVALDNGVKGGKWFSLIDKVYRPATLQAAWRKVAANAGAAGVDRQSIEQFAARAELYLAELEATLKEQPDSLPVLLQLAKAPGKRDLLPRREPLVAEHHHLMLEERSDRGDPAVHRRRCRRSPPGDGHHLVPTRSANGLPVNPLEDVGGHDPGDIDAALVQEAGEVHQVERVGPHRCRRERPRLQMGEERVRRLDTRPGARKPVPAIVSPHRHSCRTTPHRSAPPKTCSPSVPPRRKTNRHRSTRNSPMP